MDKLSMSLDDIIKLQKKEKKKLNQKSGPKPKGQPVQKNNPKKKSKQAPVRVGGKGLKQFRGRIGNKKFGASGNRLNANIKGFSPLNRNTKGPNQQGNLGNRRRQQGNVKTQHLQAKKALNQAKKKLQQQSQQLNRKQQRNQAFNQRRGLPQFKKTQQLSIHQRLGKVGQGQGQNQQQRRFRRNPGTVTGTFRRDLDLRTRKLNTSQQRKFNTNQQQGMTKKRKWGKTKQDISADPILLVSVPNQPGKSVSVQLGQNRNQTPQQRRNNAKLVQIQLAQQKRKRKQGNQQPVPQQNRVINNMLAQSQRQQQELQNQVSQLQNVIANIQQTSTVKQSFNMRRSDFSKSGTSLSLNERFANTGPNVAAVQMGGQDIVMSPTGGRRKRNWRNKNNTPLKQQSTTTGSRMVFL